MCNSNCIWNAQPKKRDHDSKFYAFNWSYLHFMHMKCVCVCPEQKNPKRKKGRQNKYECIGLHQTVIFYCWTKKFVEVTNTYTVIIWMVWFLCFIWLNWGVNQTIFTFKTIEFNNDHMYFKIVLFWKLFDFIWNVQPLQWTTIKTKWVP